MSFILSKLLSYLYNRETVICLGLAVCQVGIFCSLPMHWRQQSTVGKIMDGGMHGNKDRFMKHGQGWEHIQFVRISWPGVDPWGKSYFHPVWRVWRVNSSNLTTGYLDAGPSRNGRWCLGHQNLPRKCYFSYWRIWISNPNCCRALTSITQQL